MFFQVYDDLSGPNRASFYGHRKRPTIMSNGNTLVLVFNAGLDKFACCNHIGFRATYTFVSGMFAFCDDLIRIYSVSSLFVPSPVRSHCFERSVLKH